jgi:hypothetical protein
VTSYQVVKFPPRAQLPSGVTITKLPMVGRTWYKRGVAYWARRAGCVLVLLVGLAVGATFIGAAMLAAGPPGSPGFLAILVAECVFSPVSGVLFFRHLWRLGISGNSSGGNARGGAAGASTALALTHFGALGALLVVCSGLLSAGFLLGTLAIWLVPVPPAERHARYFLAAELRLQRHHRHPARKRRS